MPPLTPGPSPLAPHPWPLTSEPCPLSPHPPPLTPLTFHPSPLASIRHLCFSPPQVDLDQGAQGESFEITRIDAGFPANVPNLRGFATKFVTREIAQREGAGRSAFAASGAGAPFSYAIVDHSSTAYLDDKTPTSSPGYLIKPGPTADQSLPDDHPFVRASAFSKYTVAVARRKEAEQRVTSVYDLFGPAEPVTSIDRFLDNESLRQTECVARIIRTPLRCGPLRCGLRQGEVRGAQPWDAGDGGAPVDWRSLHSAGRFPCLLWITLFWAAETISFCAAWWRGSLSERSTCHARRTCH